MNDILQPPTERDLPAGGADRIRAGALAALAEPEPRHTGRRVAVVAAVVTTVAAGVGGAALWPAGGGSTQALAMSAAELPPELRTAAEQCLSWNHDQVARTGIEPLDRAPEVTLDDLAVATRRGDKSAMLFLTAAGYFTCDLTLGRWWREKTGSTNWDAWGDRRGWLPGPVEALSVSSSDIDGGEVMAIGRVSARVRRLVLEHGDGRTTEARLQDGAFGLISTGSSVREDARLVSYDADGNVLDRLRFFDMRLDRCYVDPAGKVVYRAEYAGKQPPPVDPATCLPAEAWRR